MLRGSIRFAAKWLATAGVALVICGAAAAQPKRGNVQPSAAPVEIPALIEHLPNWERVRDKTTYATNPDQLRSAIGDRQLLKLVDFTVDTEAVTALYDAGRLVIIEYSSPQASIEADTAIKAALENDPSASSTVYRRIGNYNTFVFDAPDRAAANALLDQVKYEKEIQWLGGTPSIYSEHAFVEKLTDIFLSTVSVILIWMGASLGIGAVAGYAYYQYREQQRAAMPTFSDAGGMTRLNLDRFTTEIASDRLLNQ
jgi:hypothetical protein